MATITLAPEYGYVVLVATGAGLTAFGLGFFAASFRKAAQVFNPNTYASAEQAAKDPAAEKFNRAQRTHHNYLENLPFILTSLIFGGIHHPVPAAALGAGWIASRLVYTAGYLDTTKKRGSGRSSGYYLSLFCQLGLIGLSVSSGFGLLRTKA